MALMAHEIRHIGEKPFQCNLCDERFASPTNLSSHLKCHATKRSSKSSVGKLLAAEGTSSNTSHSEATLAVSTQKHNSAEVTVRTNQIPAIPGCCARGPTPATNRSDVIPTTSDTSVLQTEGVTRWPTTLVESTCANAV